MSETSDIEAEEEEIAVALYAAWKAAGLADVLKRAPERGLVVMPPLGNRARRSGHHNSLLSLARFVAELQRELTTARAEVAHLRTLLANDPE